MSSFFRDTNLFKPRKIIQSAPLPLNNKEIKSISNETRENLTIVRTSPLENSPSTPIKRSGNDEINKEEVETEEDENSDDSFQIMEVRDVSDDHIKGIDRNLNKDKNSETFRDSTQAQSPDGDFEQPLLISINNLKKRLDQTTNKLVSSRCKNEQKDAIIKRLQSKSEESATKLMSTQAKLEAQALHIRTLKDKTDDIAGRLSEEKLRTASLDKKVEKLIDELKSKDIIKDSLERLFTKVGESHTQLETNISCKIEQGLKL